MEIIVLTEGFPYSNKFTFIKDEIPILCSTFSTVHIISLTDSCTILSNLPENCKIIPAMRDRNVFIIALKCAKYLFYPRVWREVLFAKKELRIKSIAKTFKKIIGYEYSSDLFVKVINDTLKHNQIKLIYSYWMSYGAYAMSKIATNGIVMVSRAHGYDLYLERGYIPYRREVLSTLDKVYCISNAGIRSISRMIFPHMGNLKLPDLLVRRLGVFDQFEGNGFISKELDRKYTIVSCSNVIQLKRLDIIINALCRIKDINVRWIHFGDGNLFEEMKTLAEIRLKGLSNIEYCWEGRTNREEIFDFYRHNFVDLFINCSDTEGIPVSIMEANMFSIPAIVRDVGGNTEIVNNHINGIVLNKNADAPELALAIKEYLMLDQTIKDKYRIEARNTYLKLYDAKMNYEKFACELLRLIEERDYRGDIA